MKNNLIVKASAGTGKTFAIATQFIRLLVLQSGKVAPETILGLTFSRAAAQEIYEKTLDRLRAAAESEAGAAREKATLLEGLDGADAATAATCDFSPAAFRATLRRVIEAQGHGTIATLDSFIQRVVQKFPLEMGFQKSLSVLDDYGSASAVESAVETLLSSTSGDEDLVKAFFASQSGAAVRSGLAPIGELTELGRGDTWLRFLREHPEACEWTESSMAAALGIQRDPLPPDLSAIRATGKSNDPKTSVVKRVESCAGGNADKTAVAKFFDGRPGELMRHLLRNPDATSYCYETESGNPREIKCEPAEAEAIRAAARYLAATALNMAIDVVVARLRICKAVEDRYDAVARRTGMLTFSDFTDKLAGNSGAESLSGGGRDVSGWLLDLQFRLDSRFAHWALDEFQDTSEAQWRCLSPLVEAAVSDGAGGGERSVLAVGDLKQSIYRWRGGCNEPFESLERTIRMNRGAVETLARSWRYGENTARFIDSVFGPDNVRSFASGACETAVKTWETECWPEGGHRSATGGGDYVEVVPVSAESAGEESEDDDSGGSDDVRPSSAMRKFAPKICECVRLMWERHEKDRAAALASGRKFSVDDIGILVRRNGDGLYLAERLRAMETDSGKPIPVVWEGASGVLDSPVVRAVLELLRLSEHPEDKFAWEVVNRIFPLREALFPKLETAAGVSAAVARSLSKHGLSRTLESFASALRDRAFGLDERTVVRLGQLVREAAKFEVRPDGGALEGFRKYLESVSDREIASSPCVVRILTIHRSKGLTLSHVVVPVTSSDSMLEPGSKSRIVGEGWALDGSVGKFADASEPLRKAWDAASDGHFLDELCTWYVALTRAVKSTHVFVLDGGRGNKKFSDLLLGAFPGAEHHQSDWGSQVFSSGVPPQFVTFAKGKAGGGETISRDETLPWRFDAGMERVRHATPSEAMAAHGGAARVSVSSLFDNEDDRAEAVRLGLEEHSAFAAIEWIDPGAPKDERERRILQWGGHWREAFLKTPDAMVWRERGYERLADGDDGETTWETGQFDRVVFRGDGNDRAAIIYDFKTNAMRGRSVEAFETDMAQAYAGQMAAYRTALSALTGLPTERIRAFLLLSSSGTAKEV